VLLGLVGCGAVGAPGDSGDGTDVDGTDVATDSDDPAIDAAGLDAAWGAQPTVSIDGPGVIDSFCSPPGRYDILIVGPAGAVVDLGLSITGGQLEPGVVGSYTIPSTGELALQVDVTGFRAASVTINVEVIDAHERSSTDMITSTTTSGEFC
jgi:hypothetical protein